MEEHITNEFWFDKELMLFCCWTFWQKVGIKKGQRRDEENRGNVVFRNLFKGYLKTKVYIKKSKIEFRYKVP